MQIASINADKLLRYISLLSILFYLGGVTYNIYYYSSFNIDILSYIDWTESLLLFIPFLFGILFLSVLGTPLMYFISNFFIQRSFAKEIKKGKEPVIWKEAVWYSFGSLLFGALAFVFRSLLGDLFYFTISLTVPLVIFYITQLVLSNYRRKKKAPFSFGYFVPLFVILFISYLLIEGNDRIREIQKNTPRVEVSFLFSDSVQIKTDSEFVFVGQARNYIFFYNKRTKTASVFSKEAVHKIDFRKVR